MRVARYSYVVIWCNLRAESARAHRAVSLIDMDIANSQTNLTKNQSEYFGRIY